MNFKRCDGPGYILRGTGVGKNPKGKPGDVEVPKERWKKVPAGKRSVSAGITSLLEIIWNEDDSRGPVTHTLLLHSRRQEFHLWVGS